MAGSISRKKSGFTLVEVIVVMAIIAILALLVAGAIMIAKKTAIETINRANVRTARVCIEAYYAKYGAYCRNDKNNKCDGREEDNVDNTGIVINEIRDEIVADGVPCSFAQTSTKPGFCETEEVPFSEGCSGEFHFLEPDRYELRTYNSTASGDDQYMETMIGP